MADNRTKHLKLENEIKLFVKNKIKNVKYVDEIFPMYSFKIEISQYENDDKSYEELYRFKKILQLTINCYNNFEMYKNHWFKFIQNRNSSYNPLELFCKYDRNIDLWMSHCIPDDGNVAVALFNYVLCFLSIEKNAEKIYIDRCSFCDQAMTPYDIKCSLCDATIEEIRMNIKGKKSTDNNGGDVGVDIDKGSQQKYQYGLTVEHESKNTVDVTDVSNVRREEEETKRQEGNNDEWKQVTDSDKLKCGRCGLCNEYVSIICEVCGEVYEKGRWTCRHCTMGNSCANDTCEMCRNRNDNIKLINAVVIKRLSNYQDGGNAGSDKGWVVYTKQLSGDNDKAVSVKGPLDTVHIQVETKDDLKKSDNMNKWKCGGCGFFNGFKFLNCTVCGGLYKDGTWICGHCKTKNRSTNDACGKCGKKNAYLPNKPKARGDQNMLGMQRNTGDDHALLNDGGGGCNSTKKDKETHIPEDEWKCGHCGVRQSYVHTVCDICHHSRDIYGLWMCGKCSFISRCDEERCSVCGEWNKYCPKTYCHYCKKNRVTRTEVRCDECANNQNIRWQCPYRSCDAGNNGTDEYCWKCKLWRRNSQNRGSEAKQSHEGKERNIWVCYKCYTVNELSRAHCSKRLCGNTRYAKIKCIHCSAYNDDVSNICGHCYKQIR